MKFIFEKYSKREVIESIDSICQKITACYPDIASQDDEKKDDDNEGGEEFEGGDATQYQSKFARELFLAYHENRFFADLVKSKVAAEEFQPFFDDLFGAGFMSPSQLNFDGKPKIDVGFAAALIYAYISSQSHEVMEATFSAYFNDDDKAELLEVTASGGKKSLIFPFII